MVALWLCETVAIAMGVLTRYLTAMYLARFGFLLICISVFVLSLDLVTNAEKVVEQSQAGITDLTKYAAFRLPQIFSDSIKSSFISPSAMVMSPEIEIVSLPVIRKLFELTFS